MLIKSFLNSYQINKNVLNGLTVNKNILERSPNRDIISFESQKRKISEYLKNKSEADFPSRVYQYLTEQVKNGNGNDRVSIYDVHHKIYENLGNARTLDEAKKMYPEFECVLELKEAYKNKKTKSKLLQDMLTGAQQEPEGGIALYLLKYSYRVGENDLLEKSLCQHLSKSLNIPKMPKNYLAFLRQYSEESLNRIKEQSSIISKKRWADPEYKQKVSESIKMAHSTPERREAASQKMKERWQDEEYRQRYSEGLQERWADPEYKQRVSESIKKANSTPERVESASKRMKERWQDEEFRQKNSEKLQERWTDPEYRKKMGDHARERWQDEDYKAEVSQLIHKALSTPERREAAAQRTKENWENPEYRQRVSESVRLSYNDPERREAASQKMKERWQDEEYRQRYSEGLQERWADPEYKQRVSESIKKAHNTPERVEAASKRMKELWQNEEFRQKASLHMKELWQNPDYRIKRKASAESRALKSQAFKLAWAALNPQVREFAQELRAKNPYISVILAKVSAGQELSELDSFKLSSYYKEVWNSNEGASKEFGRLYHQFYQQLKNEKSS